jgi:four helix bundle protein
MNDFKETMKKRTREAAIAIIKECQNLPPGTSYLTITRQVTRSATSIGANYRSACRAKSKSDFINKMHLVEEECDESIYWMELLDDILEAKSKNIRNIIIELNEILSVVVTAIKSAKGLRKENS